VNSKQSKTLKAIFANPVSGTIIWCDIEALFVALGATITEGNGSRIRVRYGTETAYFHRPHPGREALRYRVLDAREFLTRIGVSA